MSDGLFDPSKDYYGVLGVNSTVSQDELKATYVQLALQYHPDTAPQHHAKGVDPATKFRIVAEAWAILSKPEIKSKYDAERAYYIRSLAKDKFSVEVNTISSSPTSFVDVDNISTTFLTQRDKFAKIRHLGSSNWEDIRSKYKTEKWQKTPLYVKKLHRTRNVTSGSFFMSTVIGAVLLGVTLVTAYRRSS